MRDDERKIRVDEEGWLDDDDYSLKEALVYSTLTIILLFGLAYLIA